MSRGDRLFSVILPNSFCEEWQNAMRLSSNAEFMDFLSLCTFVKWPVVVLRIVEVHDFENVSAWRCEWRQCLCAQVTGCLLVGVGVWQHAHRERLWYGALLTTASGPTDGPETTTTDQSLDRMTTLLVGVGTLLLVVSFLGCCGACVDSVCFLGFVSHVSCSFATSSGTIICIYATTVVITSIPSLCMSYN